MNRVRTTCAGLLLLVLGGIVWASGTPERVRFDYDTVRSLEVDASIFDVDVVAGGHGVEVEVRDIPRGFRVDHSNRRGNVQLVIRGDRAPWFSHSTGQPRVIVRLAADADLSIDLASGSIVVEERRGECEFHTASGDIEIIGVTGGVDVSTASGRVDLESVTGRIEVDTAGGDVTIEDGRGSFSLSTASGAIEAHEVQLVGDNEFATVSGDIEVRLTNSLDQISFSAETVSGDIRIGDARAERRFEQPGGAIVLRLKTVSGDIDVDR